MHITSLEKQTVRIGAKLLADLQLLEKQTPFSYSGIARKAIRKYRRLRPDLSAVEVDSTYTGTDRKSTRLNSSHVRTSRMPSSA